MLLKTLFPILLLFSFTFGCQSFSTYVNQGGVLLTIEVKTDEPNPEQITANAVKILQMRMNAMGNDAEIVKILPNSLQAKIYNPKDLDEVTRILLTESKFELRRVNSVASDGFPSRDAALKSLPNSVLPANLKILPFSQNDKKSWVIVEDPAILNGNDVRDASVASKTAGTYGFEITFNLNPEGAAKFGDWTGKNAGRNLAIILNDEIKSMPVIRGQIFDSGKISGGFTAQEATDLALILRSGYLPAKLTLISVKVL